MSHSKTKTCYLLLYLVPAILEVWTLSCSFVMLVMECLALLIGTSVMQRWLRWFVVPVAGCFLIYEEPDMSSALVAKQLILYWKVAPSSLFSFFPSINCLILFGLYQQHSCGLEGVGMKRIRLPFN